MNRSTTYLLGSVLMLAACAGDAPPRINDDLGIEMPASWSNQIDESATNTTLSNDWWRDFKDERLNRLIVAGLTDNRNMRAVMARLEAAVAAHQIAGGPLLPEIDVGLQTDRARRLFIGFPFGTGGVPSSNVTTNGLSLGVRWELDVWSRLRSQDSAALADQQAAVEDLHAAQLSLAAQICRAWFAAIEADQQLALAEATAQAFKRTLADVTARFRRGVRPALEVHQAATNLANASANAALRKDQHLRAMRQIDVLVGRYPNGRTAIAKTLPKSLPQVPAGLPSDLLQRRPDLIAAERRVAAAGCRVESAKAALYPRLSLTASGGTQSLELDDLVNTDFRVWSIGANLLEPLFRGGSLRAEVRRQQARRAEAFSNYGNAVLTAFSEVENILSSDEQLQSRRDRLGEAAKQAALARDLARERWQLGLTNFLTVADGQRQAFQTESARITADRQLIDNRIDLLLALGGGFGNEATEQSR